MHIKISLPSTRNLLIAIIVTNGFFEWTIYSPEKLSLEWKIKNKEKRNYAKTELTLKEAPRVYKFVKVYEEGLLKFELTELLATKYKKTDKQCGSSPYKI